MNTQVKFRYSERTGFKMILINDLPSLFVTRLSHLPYMAYRIIAPSVEFKRDLSRHTRVFESARTHSTVVACTAMPLRADGDVGNGCGMSV